MDYNLNEKSELTHRILTILRIYSKPLKLRQRIPKKSSNFRQLSGYDWKIWIFSRRILKCSRYPRIFLRSPPHFQTIIEKPMSQIRIFMSNLAVLKTPSHLNIMRKLEIFIVFKKLFQFCNILESSYLSSFLNMVTLVILEICEISSILTVSSSLVIRQNFTFYRIRKFCRFVKLKFS